MNSKSLNPKTLKEFIGKEEIIKLLSVGIKVFKNTGKSLDHILLYGPPGVGKTSLSFAIANEMKVNMKVVQGSSVQTMEDFLGILSSLKKSEILFIDEIHSLKSEIAEVIYPALENKFLNLIIGKNLKKKSIRIPFPDCTVIAATTHPGNMEKALEDRFGYVLYMDSYTDKELLEIVKAMSKKIKVKLKKADMAQIIEAARGIPRNAIKILKRIKDYELAQEKEEVEKIIVECGFVYKGLNVMDMKYLKTLFESEFSSLKSISYKIDLDEKTIINRIEPYLFSKDLIAKNNKGRYLTEKGKKLIKQQLVN